MRRRRFLRTGAAVATVGAASTVVTGSAAEFGPIGEVPLEGAKELVVGEQGTVAYVATTTGFATVDVSDPANPQVLADRRALLEDREDGPMRQIYDVKVEGDRLVVAGPANPIRGTLFGFVLYDVSDPADPRQVAFQPTEHSIHNAFVDGDHVYLTGNGLQGNPLMVWNVADDDPERVAQWSLFDHDPDWQDVDSGLYVLHDVFVQDGLAYLAYWDAGSWILDVSDPASPEYVTHFGDYERADLEEYVLEEASREATEPPGNAHYATVDDDGDLFAIGGESWEVNRLTDDGGPSGIDLWDLSDPTAPEKLSTIEAAEVDDASQGSGVWTTSHNFEIRGERLYSSWYQDGVKVHDVSDPANPELLAHWREPEEASFWIAQLAEPGEFFVASNAAIPQGGEASVMTFPDEAGSQASMPRLEPTPTPTPEPTPTAEPTPESTPEPTSTRTPTSEPTPTAEESSPGFGPLAALGGLSLGGWRYLRRRDGE